MFNLHNKKILVTGHTGFLGFHIVEHLLDMGLNPVLPKKKYDLRGYEETLCVFNDTRPNVIIHCAAKQGGIQYNRENPALMFEDNMAMALNIVKACKERKVEKLVNIAASCSYPDVPVLVEDHYHDGLPNDSVRAHGMVKRAIFELCHAYHQQHGLNTITLCLTNLFGPKGHFNDQGKVVEMAIMKLVDAVNSKSKECVFWGTGSPMREFMYAPDAAAAIVKATEQYEDPHEILNIGTGEEWMIKDLVELIADYVNYKGKIVWDTTKSDGQMRKLLDITKMNNILDFTPSEFTTSLYDTIDWYLVHKNIKLRTK